MVDRVVDRRVDRTPVRQVNRAPRQMRDRFGPTEQRPGRTFDQVAQKQEQSYNQIRPQISPPVPPPQEPEQESLLRRASKDPWLMGQDLARTAAGVWEYIKAKDAIVTAKAAAKARAVETAAANAAGGIGGAIGSAINTGAASVATMMHGLAAGGTKAAGNTAAGFSALNVPSAMEENVYKPLASRYTDPDFIDPRGYWTMDFAPEFLQPTGAEQGSYFAGPTDAAELDARGRNLERLGIFAPEEDRVYQDTRNDTPGIQREREGLAEQRAMLDERIAQRAAERFGVEPEEIMEDIARARRSLVMSPAMNTDKVATRIRQTFGREPERLQRLVELYDDPDFFTSNMREYIDPELLGGLRR